VVAFSAGNRNSTPDQVRDKLCPENALADAANAPRPAASATATAAAAAATAAASAASAAASASSAAPTPAASGKLFAEPGRSGVLLVEDIECPQADVGDFLFIEGDLLTKREIRRRCLRCRHCSCCGCAARERQRHANGPQHGHRFLLTRSLRSLFRTWHVVLPCLPANVRRPRRYSYASHQQLASPMTHADELTVGLRAQRLHERVFRHDLVMNACSETTLLLPLSLIRTRQVALDNVTPCVQFHLTPNDAPTMTIKTCISLPTRLSGPG
jgi:hypothetical protein